LVSQPRGYAAIFRFSIHTFLKFLSALEDKLTGDNKSLDKFFSKAAKTNGISKNSVEKLADLFIKN